MNCEGRLWAALFPFFIGVMVPKNLVPSNFMF
jgi:hypothetical protein